MRKSLLQPMTANDVIDLVPDEILDRLADETGVDYSVQKLHGKIVFKLFLFAVLNQRKISLRILEEIFNSHKFQALFTIPKRTIRHSGLGMRLATIDFRYFERIFDYLLSSLRLTSIRFGDKLVSIRKIDSTLVTISAKLMSFGIENSHGNKKNLKFSMELTDGLPVNFLLFTEQNAMSEDIALPVLIGQKPRNNGINIAIFDRGVQKKKTFTDLTAQGIYFISRLSGQSYEVISEQPLSETNTQTLTILTDQQIRFSKRKTRTRVITMPQSLRLIIGKQKQDGKLIQFLTNVSFLSATEIADLYRSRWEIETFFKFIKQELGFSHFLSRTRNGVLATMYLTMITAIFLTIYKKSNRIASWVAAKIRFMDELEHELMQTWYQQLTAALAHSDSTDYLDSS